NDGKPIEGVSVEVYQRRGGREDMPGFITEDKVFIGKTGTDGRFALPNRPAPAHETVGGYKLADNPFRKIDVVGTNGLLLARLSKRTADPASAEEGPVEYHFLRIFDFNVAYLRGHTDEYVHLLQTRFAPPAAPKPMDIARLYFKPGMPPGRASYQ